MPNFNWDTEENCYILEKSLDGNNFNITVPAYGRERAFLGDIKIKTHFKEYTLKNNTLNETSININSIKGICQEIFSVDPNYVGTKSFDINSSEKGILLENNKTYEERFLFYLPGNNYSRRLNLNYIQNVPNVTSPRYVPILENGDFTDGRIYLYIHLLGSSTDIFKMNNQGQEYELGWGGCLWCSKYNENRSTWYFISQFGESSISLYGTPYFTAFNGLWEIKATLDAI